MKSYFFIPATKLNKISFIQSLGIADIIIDFEDAVLEVKREELLLGIEGVVEFKKFWYRIPVRNSFEESVSLDFLFKILDLGIRKIILPKLKSKKDLELVFNQIKKYNQLKIILLIEHPRLLMESSQILQVQELETLIYGMGIGSHDLMTFLNAEHSEEQLFFPRIQVLYLAKAFQKQAIDIASMNIKDKKSFEDELYFGFANGYDAKFLIHPNQIKWVQNYEGLKLKQITWAKNIISALPKDYVGKEIEPFILNGQIIEKPHVEKAQSILKKYTYEK